MNDIDKISSESSKKYRIGINLSARNRLLSRRKLIRFQALMAQRVPTECQYFLVNTSIFGAILYYGLVKRVGRKQDLKPPLDVIIFLPQIQTRLPFGLSEMHSNTSNIVVNATQAVVSRMDEKQVFLVPVDDIRAIAGVTEYLFNRRSYE